MVSLKIKYVLGVAKVNEFIRNSEHIFSYALIYKNKIM